MGSRARLPLLRWASRAAKRRGFGQFSVQPASIRDELPQKCVKDFAVCPRHLEREFSVDVNDDRRFWKAAVASLHAGIAKLVDQDSPRRSHVVAEASRHFFTLSDSPRLWNGLSLPRA